MSTIAQSESFLFDKEGDLSDMSQEEFDLWVKSQIDSVNGMIKKNKSVKKEEKIQKKQSGWFSYFRFIFA